MNKTGNLIISVVMLAGALVSGCAASAQNAGNMAKYAVPDQEAEWIRAGEPIVYEGVSWYPQDRVDLLLDAEVFHAGDYREVPFFISRIDVRPIDRLYTKFGRNKFRVYLPKD
ncbi:MAG: hypothetical protein ACLFPX_04175 [Candidatus Omnitrophota bacterium]